MYFLLHCFGDSEGELNIWESAVFTYMLDIKSHLFSIYIKNSVLVELVSQDETKQMSKIYFTSVIYYCLLITVISD